MLNSFPPFPPDNLPNHHLADAELRSQNSMRYAYGFAYFSHFIFGEDSVTPIPPFGYAVKSIILRSAKEKMRWTKARFVIAAMANKYTFRYFPHKELIRKAVGSEFLAVVFNLPIPIRKANPRPFNASIIVRSISDHLLEKIVAGNLVLHLSALLWRRCMAFAALIRCGAFSILHDRKYA
jgi:hypothetical protein